MAGFFFPAVESAWLDRFTAATPPAPAMAPVLIANPAESSANAAAAAINVLIVPSSRI